MKKEQTTPCGPLSRLCPSSLLHCSLVTMSCCQLYHHLHDLLVVIHPTLAPKVLGKNFSLSREVASLLGLDQQIPSVPVLKLLQALSHSSRTFPLETLHDSTNCCYKDLNMLLQEHCSSWDEVASAVAQEEPFILVGSLFVPVTAVARPQEHGRSTG